MLSVAPYDPTETPGAAGLAPEQTVALGEPVRLLDDPAPWGPWSRWESLPVLDELAAPPRSRAGGWRSRDNEQPLRSAHRGDKPHTLQFFQILAARLGMHWVNLGLLPGWNSSAASEHDLNRLGVSLGAAAQTNIDEGPEDVHKVRRGDGRALGPAGRRDREDLPGRPCPGCLIIYCIFLVSRA